MYEDFYQLEGRPFQLTPDPRFYYESQTHRKAMAYLSYGLNQGEGFIIVTGDIGAGKTTLVGHLFESLDPEEYVFAKVVTTQLDADNLLKMVASAFGLDTANTDKASLLERIETFLKAQDAQKKRVLLIVDEAQNLPNSALEELRMLSNFQTGDRALLQSFLLGQPEFRDRLATARELEQLRQRVIATHHLEPMQRDEIAPYIEHRLKLVGWTDDPEFTRDAFDTIYDYSRGVPRRLNTLVSRILLYGALEELHKIDRDVVEAVIDDLEADNRAAGAKMAHGETGAREVVRSSNTRRPNTPLKMAEDAGAGMNGEYVTLEDLDQRLKILEHYVKSHDQVIKKTIEVLSLLSDDDQSISGN